jgi:hypothetical protein
MLYPVPTAKNRSIYGFFHPSLLNLAMQPNGNASTAISIIAMNAEGKLKAVCKTRLIVENERSKICSLTRNPLATLWFYRGC